MATPEIVGIDHADDDHELVADRWAGHTRELTGLGDGGTPDRPDSTNRAGTETARYATEDRDRCAYFDELREADGSARDGVARDGGDSWDNAVLRFRERWAEHQERWPASARDAVDKSADPPGSWRGDSGRYLDAADNAEVEARCERVAEAERTKISPAMREIEAADPTRELVGWDHRLKSPDRIREKVATTLEEQPRLTAREATEDVPDCLRFTFCYTETQYMVGVAADTGRLKEYGFEQLPLRNTWDNDQYKGINSRWRDLDTGIRVEVQFHTHESYEAKEASHGVYERLRDPQTTSTEVRELRELQKELATHIRVPHGAIEIKVMKDAEGNLLRDSDRSLISPGPCGCAQAHRN